MIYSILSLFVFYQSSSASRLLMQAPEFVPIGTTRAPPPPAAGTTAPPAGAAVPPAAGTTVPPAGKGGNVVLPGQGGPSTLPPLPPLPGQGGGPQLEMNCVVDYNVPGAGNCAGKMQTIPNAAQNFKMNCGAIGSCAQSTYTFDYAPGGRVERIEGIWFTEAYAGWGTTIVINNRQGGNTVKLDKLECSGATTCMDLTIILNNAEVNDVICDYPQDCPNCFIKEGPLDPAPKPCYGY